MILRRFMKHVREQNWFAVGLDVLVVIVGIFLGLQVQSWYDNQQLRNLEKGYLENLVEDIDASLAIIRESMIERDFVEQGMMDVLDSYAGKKNIDELSNLQCRALAISHKQANPISDLPVAQELVSSGNLQIISNEDIRRGVSNYFGVLDILRDRRTSTQLFMVDLTGLYPDIIRIDLNNARNLNSNNNPAHKCDFSNGINNQRFINNLSMNSGRQWQLSRSIREQIAALDKLKQLVVAELAQLE